MFVSFPFIFHASGLKSRRLRAMAPHRPCAVTSTAGAAAAPAPAPTAAREARHGARAAGGVTEPITLLSRTCRNRGFKFNYTTACYQNTSCLSSKFGQRFIQHLGRPRPSTVTAPFPDLPLLFLLAQSLQRWGELELRNGPHRCTATRMNVPSLRYTLTPQSIRWSSPF